MVITETKLVFLLISSLLERVYLLGNFICLGQGCEPALIPIKKREVCEHEIPQQNMNSTNLHLLIKL